MPFLIRDLPPTSYYYLDGDNTGTFSVKNGAGYIHGIVLNAISTAGVLTLFDNTSEDETGTMIASINLAVRAAGSQVPMFLPYDVEFMTGLFGTITGYADITFSYK